MSNDLEPRLKEALQQVKYPGFDGDIVSMGLVKSAVLKGGEAHIAMRTISAPESVREELENAIAAKVSQVSGVSELALDMPEPPQPKAKEGPKPIEGVRHVLPVASGKGGVGKSTVAVNLALGLRDLGLKVGLLDLDLYGPSIPIMLNLRDANPEASDKKLVPVEAHGLKVLSIGFMIKSESALVWRGPLVMKAVRQLLHDVAWGPLDVLVLDLPPGTGDVQITMCQEAPLTGAVIVTTPQDVALADAIKGVDMFRTVDAPVLGIVENMSYFVCPDCGGRHEIFGHGSVEPLAAKLGVDFLGEVPLDAAVPRQADQGHPAITLDTPTAQAYRDIAQRVKDKLG